jgi:hypothetical protein
MIEGSTTSFYRNFYFYYYLDPQTLFKSRKLKAVRRNEMLKTSSTIFLNIFHSFNL